MHTVNVPSLSAWRCPLMLEMSGSENILCCPGMAVHLIELSHDPLSSGYAYDSVPPGQAVMEHDSMDKPTPTIEVNMTGHTENVFSLVHEDLMSVSKLVHSSMVLIDDHAVSILGDY